ncbi:MAG: alpha-hydroxy-acid oxidizing protein [Pseudolabrys sp.]|nr:alpha-hydroxy-acid oxidizing protein [Pseudolabrys sp.]
MDDTTAPQSFLPTGTSPRFQQYLRRFPTSAYLRRAAPRNVPFFAFEYGDTGAGNDVGIAHNWSAFDDIKVVPHYGVMTRLPPTGVELFGTKYAAPLGIAPMGGPSLVWPGADVLMAKAAQEARVPYTLGVAGGATIEEIAKVAPDVFWLQLYRFSRNDHKIGFDLIDRAQAAGVKVLTLTLDTPVRTTRSRETYAGLGGAFKPTPRMIYEMMIRPKWLLALLRNGYPRFATIRSYAGKNAGTNETIAFARSEMGGAFSWEEVKRYRDRWKGPMTVKGILHPEDAEKAVSLGVDGIWVSNHGGRQIEAVAPSIDCLPGIVSAVGNKATILLDSGIRGGQDVMRALALGADAAFAGKSFLWAVAALGDDGPAHLIDLYIDELRASLGQIGAHSPAEARLAKVLHPGKIEF